MAWDSNYSYNSCTTLLQSHRTIMSHEHTIAGRQRAAPVWATVDVSCSRKQPSGPPISNPAVLPSRPRCQQTLLDSSREPMFTNHSTTESPRCVIIVCKTFCNKWTEKRFLALPFFLTSSMHSIFFCYHITFQKYSQLKWEAYFFRLLSISHWTLNLSRRDWYSWSIFSYHPYNTCLSRHMS